MIELERIAPVLPVRTISAAIEHYRSLGFAVRAYQGDAPYAFAECDGGQLHLTQVTSLDPATNTSAIYLYVRDAVDVHRQWRDSGIGGRLIPPTPTEYGLNEGAHIDPDGNLLRFGSPVQGAGSGS